MPDMLDALRALLASLLKLQALLIELEIAQAAKRQEEEVDAEFEQWMRDAWR